MEQLFFLLQQIIYYFFNADATNNRPKANNIYTIPNVKISDMTSIYVN